MPPPAAARSSPNASRRRQDFVGVREAGVVAIQPAERRLALPNQLFENRRLIVSSMRVVLPQRLRRRERRRTPCAASSLLRALARVGVE